MTRRRILLLLLPLVLLPVLAAAAPAGDTPPASPGLLAPPDRLAYPPLDFPVPRAERFELPNGIVVYFLEDREVPLVTVQAYLKGGSLLDPDGKEGLAELLATVMRTGGTHSRTGREVDERLEFLAADAEASAGLETISASLSVLKKDLEEGLALFSGMLREPAFEEERLVLARELKKEDLRRIADDPARFAFREFGRFQYRQGPWARLSSLASLDAVLRQDLVSHHRRLFTPRNLWIAVSGDLSREEAREALQRHFGSWTAADIPGTEAPQPVPGRRGIRLVSREISQSVLIVGHPAPSRSAPDYHAFQVLDFLLGGGGFSSRIFQEIRTDRGLAYSTGSFYRSRLKHGVFGAYAITRTDATLSVLAHLERILAESGRGAFKDQDLQAARESMLHRFIFSFQSPEQVVRQRLLVEFDRLPADFLESYRKNIRKVTTGDIEAAALRWLDASRASILVLGDPRGFGGRLDSFGEMMNAP